MNFSYTRRYTGPLQAVIFDWAGTIIDFGCMAPAQVFSKIYAHKGIEVSDKQAREPMGLQKRDHIAAIAAMPDIKKQWEAKYNRPINEADIDEMFTSFVPLQQDVVKDYAGLIPGALEVVNSLKEEGLKIGSTTGYTGKIMEVVSPIASQQGYTPDCLVTGDLAPKGRPAPFMLFENLRQLNVFPLPAVVKVGDTLPDIEEGLNAGVWSVAVVDSSNEIGMNYETWSQLDEHTKEGYRAGVRTKFLKAGAHYVIDAIDELPDVLEEISYLLLEGRQP